MENISFVTSTQFVTATVHIVRPLFVSAEDDWRLKTLQIVLNMAQLPKGPEPWRLKVPQPMARLRALQLVEALVEWAELHHLAVPFVVSTAERGVQFEWSNKQREIEVGFLPDGSAEFLKIQNGKPVEEGPLGAVSESVLRPIFKWLLSA